MFEFSIFKYGDFESLQDKGVVMVISTGVGVEVKAIGADELKELKD